MPVSLLSSYRLNCVRQAVLVCFLVALADAQNPVFYRNIFPRETKRSLLFLYAKPAAFCLYLRAFLTTFAHEGESGYTVGGTDGADYGDSNWGIFPGLRWRYETNVGFRCT